MPDLDPAEREADPLLAYRDRFPILSTTNYLISNSLGAVPRAAEAQLRGYYETWATRGVRAWEETWWTLVATLGDRVAPLIGAQAGDVVFQPNVTLAHALLFSAFDFRAGRPRVVTDAMHFPSLLYLLDGLKAQGAEVVVVPSDDGVSVDTERLLAAIDERTAFVNVSHVLFKSAYIHDVAAIAARAYEVGAYSIVDGYQSVGTIPVDVEALGVDAYIGGCLKWLCGGPGAAFLWVRPELQSRLTPRLTGWMAHERPFDFAPELRRRDDIWRFLHGTPAIPALYAARAGLEVINEVGVAAIRAKSMRQTARLLERAASRGFRCTTPVDPARRGGTIALDVDHGYEVSRSLKALDILCDYRPGAGVRLSPHFYNSDAEVDAAVDTIAEILAGNAWRAFSHQRSTVT
ncbi:MAG: aminotransferase class V-fold PLP-dependent enzyme [Isosphaeraceae bacterium]